MVSGKAEKPAGRFRPVLILGHDKGWGYRAELRPRTLRGNRLGAVERFDASLAAGRADQEAGRVSGYTHGCDSDLEFARGFARLPSIGNFKQTVTLGKIRRLRVDRIP